MPAPDSAKSKPEQVLLNLWSAWLAPIKSKLPADFSQEDSLAFGRALNDEALRRFDSFIEGVRAYQDFPVARSQTRPAKIVWQEGTTRLLDYAPDGKGEAVFVIPSLINRFDILDIDPERSFLGFLAESGFRPLVLDWSAPGKEESGFSIADYMARRVFPAMDRAFAENVGPCHVMGYCMGGIMALALALKRPERVRSLSLLATPWDFSFGVGGVPGADTPWGALYVRQAQAWREHFEKQGEVPAAFLQSLFSSFQPLSILRKYEKFAHAENFAAARRFVLTEDWLNDGVPLSFPVAMECLEEWFEGNQTMKKEWRVNDLVVDPSKLAVPAFILVAEKDRIVPPESSLPLAMRIPDATFLSVPRGHIGLMASDSSKVEAWAPLASWLKAV